MTTTLCALALFALQSEMKPLPEERKLAEPEQIALSYSRIEVPKVGPIGWSKTTIQRAQMEGEPHYLVHRVGEVIDFQAMGFVTLETRGLYDENLQLVHEVRSKQPLGADAATLDLKWGEEGFRWRAGRDKWHEEGTDIRPTAETDLALMIHGLAITTPWEGQVFNDATNKVERQIIQPAKKTTVEEQEMTLFEVEGPTPVSHVLSSDGEYVQGKLGEAEIKGVRGADASELGLRASLSNNEAFMQVVNRQVPAAWSEKKGTYTNAVLGLSLKLPKGWRRAPGEEVDGTHFQAYSEDSNAYVSLTVNALGTGIALKDWGEALREGLAEDAVDREVSAKEMKFAKQDAVRHEFIQAGEFPLDTTVYSLVRNGFALTLSGGTSVASPKKLHKETASVLKSARFER